MKCGHPDRLVHRQSARSSFTTSRSPGTRAETTSRIGGFQPPRYFIGLRPTCGGWKPPIRKHAS